MLTLREVRSPMYKEIIKITMKEAQPELSENYTEEDLDRMSEIYTDFVAHTLVELGTN